MTTIAIIGAGEGLGAAVARRFGREGFSVALISREQGNVDRIAASLGDAGITAAGFAADVRNPESLTTALDSAAERLVARGLVTTADGVETLTDDGVALDRHIEDRTDAMAAAAWRGVDDAEELISSARPYVKAVISAGILPGTKKKS